MFPSSQGKLDVYRENARRGKDLNEDQKNAIAKYDEVMQNLDFARELSGQFKTLAVDEEKARKKSLKKEAIEKAKSDVARIANVLDVQVSLQLMLQ